MPISNNIIQEVNRLDIDQGTKDLMFSILKQEDEGLSIRTYKAEYKRLVDDFISGKENKNESDSY